MKMGVKGGDEGRRDEGGGRKEDQKSSIWEE